MPSTEEINEQQALLASHRRTLAAYLKREAIVGPGHVPPEVTAGIFHARNEIDRIKAVLRGWGARVDDHPNDTASEPPYVSPPALARWPWSFLIGFVAIAIIGILWATRNVSFPPLSPTPISTLATSASATPVSLSPTIIPSVTSLSEPTNTPLISPNPSTPLLPTTSAATMPSTISCVPAPNYKVTNYQRVYRDRSCAQNESECYDGVDTNKLHAALFATIKKATDSLPSVLVYSQEPVKQGQAWPVMFFFRVPDSFIAETAITETTGVFDNEHTPNLGQLLLPVVDPKPAQSLVVFYSGTRLAQYKIEGCSTDTGYKIISVVGYITGDSYIEQLP